LVPVQMLRRRYPIGSSGEWAQSSSSWQEAWQGRGCTAAAGQSNSKVLAQT
jgi:hypothetical protein